MTRENVSVRSVEEPRTRTYRAAPPWLVILLAVVVTVPILAVTGVATATQMERARPAGGTAPGWPMFHGDSALDGVAASSMPAHPRLLWQDTLGGTLNPLGNDPPYQASPVVSAGSLYVVVDNALFVVNSTRGSLLQDLSLPGGPGSGPGVGTPMLTSSGLLVEPQDGGPRSLLHSAPAALT
jgi:hypothetical protein